MDMKVSNVLKAYDVYRTDRSVASNRMSRAEENRDMMALTSQARDFMDIRKALSSTPDIRADKVASIKAKYDAGRYEVSSSDIAEKILSKLDPLG